jgi:hypothetical protein
MFLVVAAAWPMSCGKDEAGATDASATPDPAATTEPAARPGTIAAPTAASVSAPASAPEPNPSAVSSAPTLVHPLAVWMRGPATAAFNTGNLESIGASFEQMAAWAPAGYRNWASIANDGSSAARAGSLEGVKAACRGCHAQYKSQYAVQLTSRPLP